MIPSINRRISKTLESIGFNLPMSSKPEVAGDYIAWQTSNGKAVIRHRMQIRPSLEITEKPSWDLEIETSVGGSGGYQISLTRFALVDIEKIEYPVKDTRFKPAITDLIQIKLWDGPVMHFSTI